MKQFIYIVMIMLMMSSFALADNETKYPKNHWKVFTTNLVIALKSDNDGLKQSAMIQVIRYKDNLNVNKTIFPMLNIYRKHPNEKFRELAAAALHYTGNNYAENYLRINYEKETSERIKHLIKSCLKAENNVAKYTILDQELNSILASINQ